MSSRSSSASRSSSQPSEDSVQLPPAESVLLSASQPSDGAHSPSEEGHVTGEQDVSTTAKDWEGVNSVNHNESRREGEEEDIGKDSASVGNPPSTASPTGMVSLFIGLGPHARQVNAEDLRRFFESNAQDKSNILDVRHRGRCAFADISCKEEADHLISKLDGVFLEDNVRLTVQTSLNRKEDQPLSDRKEREVMRRDEGKQTLFIGLGPRGGHVTNEQLRERLAAVVPYVTVNRRRDMCAFVDVDSREDALKLIEKVNNMHVGDARLSVQISRERKRRRDSSFSRHPNSAGGPPYYPNDRRRDDFGAGRRLRRTPPPPLDDRRGGIGGPSRSHGDRRMRSRSPTSRSRSNSREDRRHTRRRRYSDDSRGDRRRPTDRQRDTGDRRRGTEDRHRHRHHRRGSSSRSYSSRSYSSRSSRSSGGSVERRRRDDRRGGGGDRHGGGIPLLSRR